MAGMATRNRRLSAARPVSLNVDMLIVLLLLCRLAMTYLTHRLIIRVWGGEESKGRALIGDGDVISLRFVNVLYTNIWLWVGVRGLLLTEASLKFCPCIFFHRAYTKEGLKVKDLRLR